MKAPIISTGNEINVVQISCSNNVLNIGLIDVLCVEFLLTVGRR